jgi:hypothetical protein
MINGPPVPPRSASRDHIERLIAIMSSLPNPASQVKPKLGESNGDREFLLQVLRVATARSKLISNTLDSIGLALRQRAVSVEDAMRWAADEGIIDLLQFGPTRAST